MPRRNQQKNRAQYAAARRAEDEMSSPRGVYEPMNRELCSGVEWSQPCEQSDSVRAVHRVWLDGKLLVDFVIVVEVLGINGWEEAERIDCCHGSAHLHPKSAPKGEVRSLVSLDSVHEVGRAYDRMQEVVDDRMRIIANEGG